MSPSRPGSRDRRHQGRDYLEAICHILFFLRAAQRGFLYLFLIYTSRDVVDKKINTLQNLAPAVAASFNS